MLASNHQRHGAWNHSPIPPSSSHPAFGSPKASRETAHASGVLHLAIEPSLLIARMPLGSLRARKNSRSHIDAYLSRQPLVKGERLVRYEVNAVMQWHSKELHACRRRRGMWPCAKGECPARAPLMGLQPKRAPWMDVLCVVFQCALQHVYLMLGRGPRKNCKNDLDDQT